MFHPDLHQQHPEKRKTSELLTQAIHGAKDQGDMELLELIAKDLQAFILNQGWASVSLDPERGLVVMRILYEHLQAKVLELIESLDELFEGDSHFEQFTTLANIVVDTILAPLRIRNCRRWCLPKSRIPPPSARVAP